MWDIYKKEHSSKLTDKSTATLQSVATRKGKDGQSDIWESAHSQPVHFNES